MGLLLGLLIGAFQGFMIAYLSVPAFIVTLGGLLVWRGAAWWVTSGRTVAPMDATFQLMGGGAEGSIGATWSWIVALVACVAIVLLTASRPHASASASDFPLRPVWAEILLGAIACAVILGAVAGRQFLSVADRRSCRHYAEANGIAMPGGRTVHRPSASPFRC